MSRSFLNKLIGILLILIATISLPAWASGMDFRDEQGFGYKPVIMIESVSAPSKVSPGQKFNVVYKLYNSGIGSAYDLQYTFMPGNNYQGASPFTVSTRPDIDNFQEGQTYTVTMEVEVSKTANFGEYDVNFNIDYKNKDGAPQPQATTKKKMTIGFGETKPQFLATDVSLNPIENSNDYLLRIVLSNKGDSPAKNIGVTLDGLTNFEVRDFSSKKHFDELKGGATVAIEYKIRNKTGRDGNQAKLSIAYEEGDGTAGAQELSLNLHLQESGGADVGVKPWVIVNKYLLSEEKILAGNNFDLSLFIENTNNREVKNIKISLTVIKLENDQYGGTVFSPIDSSNTVFIERIAGKSIVEKRIPLRVDGNAQAKTYVVPVEIVYEDYRGNELRTSETLNIPVTQEGKFMILRVEKPPMAMANNPVPISAEFVNNGKVALSNFMVNLEGEFQKENSSYYVGSFEVGASEYFQAMLIPETEGELSGAIVFSYIDSNNQEVRVEEPFTIQVEPFVMPEEPEFPPGMEPGKPQGGAGGILALVKKAWLPVVLIGVIVFQAVKLKKHKKRSKENGDYLDV